MVHHFSLRIAFLIGVTVSCWIGTSPSVCAAMLDDTDDDGLPDVWETQVFRTDPARKDTDADGHNDRTEVVYGSNPRGEGFLSEHDADNDGLSDRPELLFGTDPLAADTDGDTFSDGKEVNNGFSPTSTQMIRLHKELLIRLTSQRIEQRVMGIVLGSHLVSSGLPRTPTPIGNFKILSKNQRAWSASARLWMPYWMHFSGRGHGLHELPEWPGGRKEGANHLGKPASHGCVRMGVGVAKQVYEWSPVGTPVTIVKQ